MNYLPGMYAFYKPKGITSHDLVGKVRRLTASQKVGHGGTLDPFASGVLVIGIGQEYTKQLGVVLHETKKTYKALIHLGATSTTDDPEGEIVQQDVKEIPDFKKVKEVLQLFECEILQVPPAFSAIKQKGKRAYALARQGKTINLEPRKVVIEKIKILRYEYPIVEIEVICQSGVYVRALARDIGKALGTGAYCKELERTRVGEYAIEEAIKL